MIRRFTLAAASLAFLSTTALAGEITTRTVSFEHQGTTIAGTIYLPADVKAGEKLPAVIVTGAWTTVEEQMPSVYAREMAERGFAAMTFDFRGWGKSGGEIRFKEDPTTKTADIVAAAAFLATQPEIDAAKIGGLGICASAGYMADAVATSASLKSVALVAPWLHNETIAAEVYGGKEGVANLIQVSREADKAEAAGKPTVIEAASATNDKSLMFQVPYYTETNRGLIPAYDNKFNLGSWEPWLTYDAVAIAGRLEKPLLVVHSEKAAIPQGVRAFLADYTGKATQTWLEDVTQFDFYDNPEDVERAADAAAKHFGETVSGT